MYRYSHVIFYILFIIPLMLIYGCSGSIAPEKLYGEWEYIKVEGPKQDPPYLMPDDELREQHPSITFSNGNDLVIMWGGKKLSHGRFRLENMMIRYRETLQNGASREFPFLVKELSADRLVFETMEHDFTRVTARKAH